MSSNYRSKLSQEVVKYTELLKNKTLLSIDPSSGSIGSVPGFALFQAGHLVDAGVISLPRGNRPVANRLWQLHRALATEFAQPDVLAIELIPPIFASKGRKAGGPGFIQGVSQALTQSVGAIMSVWDVPVLFPAPMTWHSMTPPNYVKGDCLDSQMIGWACLITLARALGEPDPIITLLGVDPA